MKNIRVTDESLNNILKQLRKEKGISQRELGELCGKSDSTISAYESGVVSPNAETLQKMLAAVDAELIIVKR